MDIFFLLQKGLDKDTKDFEKRDKESTRKQMLVLYLKDLKILG